MKKKPAPKRPNNAFSNVSPVPREHIKLILRIWLADKVARQRAGLQRSTRGIIPRLAAEFNVSERMVRHLVHDHRFNNIRFAKEKHNAKQRAAARRAHPDP